jgi:hypothetical protein
MQNTFPDLPLKELQKRREDILLRFLEISSHNMHDICTKNAGRMREEGIAKL